MPRCWGHQSYGGEYTLVVGAPRGAMSVTGALIVLYLVYVELFRVDALEAVMTLR